RLCGETFCRFERPRQTAPATSMNRRSRGRETHFFSAGLPKDRSQDRDSHDMSLLETPAAPCIELDRISKRFGGVTALEQVSFEIRRGEVHAVVGENGAGKSTLMNLLAGIYQPDEGEIRLETRKVEL